MKRNIYSAIISKENDEVLFSSFKLLLAGWQKQWLANDILSVEEVFRNKRLFDAKNVDKNLSAVNLSNQSIYCEMNSSPFIALSKAAIGLNENQAFNDQEKAVIDNIAKKIKLSFLSALKSFSEQTIGEEQILKESDTSTFNVGITMQVNFGSETLQVHFSDYFLHCFSKANNKFISSQLPPVKLKGEIKNNTIDCTVAMIASEISLKQLMALKVGHVIKLNHAIDQPLIIQSANKSTPLQGFLVKDDGEKAVYLTGKTNER